MKKVTAFVGSAHRHNTHDAVVQFFDNLKALGEIETEIVTLSDYTIGVCRGCRVCFLKGEQFCPLKDDRDLLLAKIAESDGVVFASPNYSFQVSGMMKVFLDRLGFVFHRPRFFGKTFTSIVTQGIGQGGSIVKYLDFVGEFTGFNTVQGTCLTTLDPRTPKAQKKIDRQLRDLSRRYYARLMRAEIPTPSLLKLMMFRVGRTNIRQMLTERDLDFCYYRDQGWFASEYYYPARLSLFQKAVGRLFDRMARPLMDLIA